MVTGATHGVGHAIAARLVAAGFLVWAVARDELALAELVATSPAGLILPVALDLATADVDEMALAAARITGSVDALVHAAGIIETGALLDPAAIPSLVNQLRTNAIGPLLLTTILLPQLATGARIVFVNSSQGLRSDGGSGAYAVSKHAQRAIADSLRTELTGDAVGVTSIYLGRTATPMQERLYAARNEDYRPELLIQPESVAELVAAVVTLPEDVEVTDISMRPSVKSY